MFIVSYVSEFTNRKVVKIVRRDVDEHDRRVFNTSMFEGEDFTMSLPLAKGEDVYVFV